MVIQVDYKSLHVDGKLLVRAPAATRDINGSGTNTNQSVEVTQVTQLTDDIVGRTYRRRKRGGAPLPEPENTLETESLEHWRRGAVGDG